MSKSRFLTRPANQPEQTSIRCSRSGAPEAPSDDRQLTSPPSSQGRGTHCPSTSHMLQAQLKDSVMTDARGRTGYIASNYQLQFDNPPQAGAIYTAGFAVCANRSLALGSSAVFWECKSGNFWNLYDRNWAEQCSPVDILVLPCEEGTEAEPAPVPTEGGGGEGPSETVVGTQTVTSTVVVPLEDGQPQVLTTTTVIPICQIDDGASIFTFFSFFSPLLLFHAPESQLTVLPHHCRPGPGPHDALHR